MTELELESCEGDKTDWSKDGPEGRGAGLARRVVGGLFHYRRSAMDGAGQLANDVVGRYKATGRAERGGGQQGGRAEGGGLHMAVCHCKTATTGLGQGVHSTGKNCTLHTTH